MKLSLFALLVVAVTPSSLTEARSPQPDDTTRLSRGLQRSHVTSICGRDQSVPAKCFQPDSTLGSTLPLAYERSQAVARLHFGGSWCTGWLIGSEGHVITNYHCIGEDAAGGHVQFEFGAESSSCSDQCTSVGGCPGIIMETEAAPIASNASIDYALVKLPTTNAPLKYGYLQVRASGPVVNETIYIPQHPGAAAKRIAATVDDGTAAQVIQIDDTSVSCYTQGVRIVRYAADTQRGASGSPVIATRDNAVVAIHNCAGCISIGGSNTGMDMREVLRDLERKGIVVKDLVADGITTPRPTTPAPPRTPEPTTPQPTTPQPTTPAPKPPLPPAGQCAGLARAVCDSVFFCSWNKLQLNCERWWK